MFVKTSKALGPLVVALSLVDCASEGVTDLAAADGQGSVSCSSTFGSGGGRDLVSPPGACTMRWSECTDGQVYQLDCDGLGCVCSVDGVADRRMLDDDTFLSPHCPNISEAGLRCGWPIGNPPGSSSGGQALQGMPCEDGRDFVGGCECREGMWSCSGIGGCNPVGKYSPVGEELPVIDFRSNGTFYVADVTSSAGFDDIADDDASGFHGTWALAGDVLGLRSYHALPLETCNDEAGLYAVDFDEDCRLTELRLLEDDCKERRVVGIPLEPGE